MPKTNKLGGKKKKRGKNGIVENKNNKIVTATEGQFYGCVSKILGGGKFIVNCIVSNTEDVSEKTCLVRGKMRKRVWINLDDIVLVAGRDFGSLSDIIHKYSIDDHSFLYDNNCIPKKQQKIKDNIDFIDENNFDAENSDQNKYVNYNEILDNMQTDGMDDTSGSEDELTELEIEIEKD